MKLYQIRSAILFIKFFEISPNSSKCSFDNSKTFDSQRIIKLRRKSIKKNISAYIGKSSK